MFNVKAFGTIAILLVSVTGCSLFSNSQQISPYSIDARKSSVYNTSGFAFDAETSINKAMKNAQAVCKDDLVQVVSNTPKIIEYITDGKKKNVYVIDMAYRCVAS